MDTCGNPYGSCPEGQICDLYGTCVDASYLEPCEHILEESLFCITRHWMASPPRLELLGVDTGTVCPLGIEGDFLFHTPGDGSIAWIDDGLYVCNWYESPWGLTRISLSDGTVETTGIMCEAVARYNSGLIVMASPGMDGITYFESFADAKAGDGVSILVTPWASRMTAFCDSLYTAWHSTPEIDVFSLTDETRTRTIFLEDYDGWVWGMSVSEDGRLLLINEPENRIAIFDVDTGESLGNLSLGNGYHGLACATRP